MENISADSKSTPFTTFELNDRFSKPLGYFICISLSILFGFFAVEKGEIKILFLSIIPLFGLFIIKKKWKFVIAMDSSGNFYLPFDDLTPSQSKLARLTLPADNSAMISPGRAKKEVMKTTTISRIKFSKENIERIYQTNSFKEEQKKMPQETNYYKRLLRNNFVELGNDRGVVIILKKLNLAYPKNFLNLFSQINDQTNEGQKLENVTLFVGVKDPAAFINAING